ncbi:MAG: serine/threonine-protein kinase, partial [Acidobacteriota bacterium]
EDGVWLVMEYVDGITLAEEVAAGPIPSPRALDIAAQIAEGLAAIHELGFLHRDLKGENVMLQPDGRVRLLDFGLAKALRSEDDSQTLTRHGEVMGTCRAMSPEQARGRTLDGRSDLFSLGSLLYEMITGRSPFKAKTPVATMNQVCTHDPPPPHLVETEVPRPVSQLVTRLLKKKPEDRPADARAAAAEIRALHQELTGGARRRRPSSTALSLAALVAVVLGSSLVFQILEEPGAPGPPARPLLAPETRTAPSTEVPSESLPGPRRLADALARCGDAACLDGVRGEALARLESDEPGVRSSEWLQTPPPRWLPQVARVMAAVDFELGAPEAALRWLELGQEALTAMEALRGELSAADQTLQRLLETERARLESWPAPGRIARPVGPDVPALLQFSRDLERALDAPDDAELLTLVEAAKANGWVRFELQGRLEIARRTQNGELDRELADDALERGAVRIADAARALLEGPQDTDR